MTHRLILRDRYQPLVILFDGTPKECAQWPWQLSRVETSFYDSPLVNFKYGAQQSAACFRFFASWVCTRCYGYGRVRNKPRSSSSSFIWEWLGCYFNNMNRSLKLFRTGSWNLWGCGSWLQVVGTAAKLFLKLVSSHSRSARVGLIVRSNCHTRYIQSMTEYVNQELSRYTK